MSLITRDIINRDIKFYDYYDDSAKMEYDYDDISTDVDYFKNLLVDSGAKKGESVLIGFAPSIKQIALFFASCELGLSVIVADYKAMNNEEYSGFLDTKTKILMPINYFIGFDPRNLEPKDAYKFLFYKEVCETVITCEDLESYTNYNKNDTILANKNDIILRCTSSGTTGTPKLVEHTHEFLYNISKRNTSFFDGHVSLLWNLNHGSSIATYFLPSIMSSEVEQFTNILSYQKGDIIYDGIEEVLSCCNHMMIPYTEVLEHFLDAFSFSQMTYYTLSPIPKKMTTDSMKNKYKDIISFFGCNETSGPIFINKASYDNFEVDVYHKFDDYYDIEKIDTLTVRLKEYDISINTQDTFEKKDKTSLTFKGRKNLMRVNGLEVFRAYDDFVDFDANLIYDSVYNEIYLSAWIRSGKKDIEEKELIEKIKEINEKMSNMSGGSHKISKFKFLKRYLFTLGVKIDHEFLRSYFRERVENNVEV